MGLESRPFSSGNATRKFCISTLTSPADGEAYYRTIMVGRETGRNGNLAKQAVCDRAAINNNSFLFLYTHSQF